MYSINSEWELDLILQNHIKKNDNCSNMQAYVFNGNPSGECAAFLVNKNKEDVEVSFKNSSYLLPAKSISILPDCKHVIFNTAKARTLFQQHYYIFCCCFSVFESLQISTGKSSIWV